MRYVPGMGDDDEAPPEGAIPLRSENRSAYGEEAEAAKRKREERKRKGDD